MSALMPCFHVTTARGAVYGVAATGKRDALRFVAERIARDNESDAPASAVKVGTWTADYGTVFCYQGTR